MNYYDNEANIISHLQLTSIKELNFVNLTSEGLKFFSSLYKEKRFKNWINNSGKDAPPPDFYSDKYKYMLEVMRLDDFVVGNNSPNALESKFVKKIEDQFREKGMSLRTVQNMHLMVLPDITNASENGYEIYVENFKRVVHKHLAKIESYRNNHPGYKLGFLIFDEATCYSQVEDKNIEMKPNEKMRMYPHIYFWDKNLLESFLTSDLDFIIWMTLYKNLPRNPKIYPQVSIYDLKKKDRWKKNIIEYDAEKMVCMEVRE